MVRNLNIVELTETSVRCNFYLTRSIADMISHTFGYKLRKQYTKYIQELSYVCHYQMKMFITDCLHRYYVSLSLCFFL